MADITRPFPKEKLSRQQKTEKNLRILRENATDLTSKPAGKGRRPPCPKMTAVVLDFPLVKPSPHRLRYSTFTIIQVKYNSTE